MFEFMAGVFAGLFAGSIWLWLVLVAAAILITVLVEAEVGGAATVALVATVLVTDFFFKVDFLAGIKLHPWALAGWTGVYFAAGAAWGLFKWYVFVHKALAAYREVKAAFLKEAGATELTPALAYKLAQKVGLYSRRSVSSTPPAASNYKGDIIRWMSYWPFSILGTLLNDVVRKAWTNIYNFMAQTYDRIAAHVFRGVSGDAALAQQGAAEATEEQTPRKR